MAGEFVPIKDATALEDVLSRSQNEPVLVFKHDTSCPISAAAYRQMSQVPGPIPLVDVSRSKDTSQDIAQRTGVKHESPQVILFRNGEAAWHASHYSITADAVLDATRENA